LRDLERPAGFAADAYVCRNLARIDLVTDRAAFLPVAARSGQADAFAARPERPLSATKKPRTMPGL
jgi:hypothetical protein